MVNRRVPTKRGRIISDEVTLVVGNQSFDGWESVSITKNLESIANQFQVSLFDKFEGLREEWPFRPGTLVQVNVNRQPVVTGYIEKVDPGFSDEGRSFTISGRSKAGDLVDCSHEGPTEFNNVPLDKLATELIKPFGIKLFLSVEPKLIKKFAVKPGESVFEALDRAARTQGFFFVSTRAGNIRLTRAARARATDSLEQDVNLLGASASYDASQRFSTYTVKGQSFGLPDFNGESAAQAEGAASDAGVSRYRPMVMIAEGSVDSAQAKTRAQWEASSRLAKATRVNCTVQGWTQSDGILWGINQVTNFKSTILGLNRDMLITSVNHTQSSEAGQTTALTLVDPDSYTVQPTVNSKQGSDIFAGLGANF